MTHNDIYSFSLYSIKKGEYSRAHSLLFPEKDSCNPELLFLLGFLYEFGLGVDKNILKAIQFYTKAVHSESGSSSAEFRLEKLCRDNHIQDETFVSEKELENSINTNSEGYSIDKRRFLYWWEIRSDGEIYSILEGTEILCDKSFNSIDLDPDEISIKKLILPSTLRRIGNDVFCYHITNIESNSPNFIVKDGFLLSKDEKIVYRYFGQEKIVKIPDTVLWIKDGAFSMMIISEITIPNSVKYIGDNPFYGILPPVDGFNENITELKLKIRNESPFFKIQDNKLYSILDKKYIPYWDFDRTTK